MYKQNDSTNQSNEKLVNLVALLNMNVADVQICPLLDVFHCLSLILFVWLFLISFPYINKSVCQVVAPPLRWSAGASPGSLERIDVFFGSSHE